MQIRKDVVFEGAKSKDVNALIDTGASLTLLPKKIADDIGVRYTGEKRKLKGAFEGLEDEGAMAIVNVKFPFLKNLNYIVSVVVSEKASDILIGLDVLSPLNLVIDTKTHGLKVKNVVAEAVIGGLAIVGIGTIAYLILSALFGKKK